MPKRKAPELTPAEQKKRFESLAREVGAQKTSDEFKRALRATLSSGQRRKTKPK